MLFPRSKWAKCVRWGFLNHVDSFLFNPSICQWAPRKLFDMGECQCENAKCFSSHRGGGGGSKALSHRLSSSVFFCAFNRQLAAVASSPLPNTAPTLAEITFDRRLPRWSSKFLTLKSPLSAPPGRRRRRLERLLTCFDPLDLKLEPIKTLFMEPHQVSGT